MATRKAKSFGENLNQAINPAMQFISGQSQLEEGTAITPKGSLLEEEQQLAATEQRVLREAHDKPPEGYKFNPLYIETKSKRLQLLLRPTLLKRLREQAGARETSVNDYIHAILDEATKPE